MHPPNHIVEELYQIEPTARLAWDGESKTFALVQLYHKRDAERTFFGDFWSGRGPIFGRPFDPLQKVPMMIAHVSPMDVMSGAFLCRCFECKQTNSHCQKKGCDHNHKGALLTRWLTPIRDRTLASAKKKGKEYQSQINDLAEEGGDYLHYKARHSNDVGTTLPNKFVTEDDKATLRGDKIKGVENTFVEKFDTGGMPLV